MAIRRGWSLHRRGAARPLPEDMDRIRAAVASLPDIDRQVFLLHAPDEQDYATIARRLGLNVAAVEHHLARALAQLVDVLDGPLS